MVAKNKGGRSAKAQEKSDSQDAQKFANMFFAHGVTSFVF